MRFISNYTLAGMLLFTALMAGCGGGSDENSTDSKSPRPEVEITSMRVGSIVDRIEVSATSTFQAQNVVKSPITGFIVSIAVSPGQLVGRGTLLMTLQTKESRALGNALDSMSGGLKLSGIWSVKADANGFVSEVSHQVGDYVPEGESLATIVQQHSLAFVLNLPFEWRSLVHVGLPVELTMSDGTKIQGKAANPLPQANQGAQTIPWLVTVGPTKFIPAGIQALATIPSYSSRQAQLLPKSAVLSNETETRYWVMHLVDSVNAIKMDVQLGHQSGDSVEILQPKIKANDKFLVSGNYGVPDTLLVKVISK